MKTCLGKIRRAIETSVQVRLTCYFIIILVPLIFVSLYANVESQKILEDQMSHRTYRSMTSVMDEIDTVIQQVDELATILANDRNLNNILNNAEAELSSQSIIEFKNIKEQINTIRTLNPLVSEVTIWHDPSSLVLSSTFGGRRIEDYKQQDWYQEAAAIGADKLLLIPQSNLFNVNEVLNPVFNRSSFSIIRLMDVYNVKANHNLLAVTIKREELYRQMNQLTSLSGTKMYLFSEQGDLIVSNQPQQDINLTSLERSMKGRTELSITSDYSGWSLVLLQPEGVVVEESVRVRQFTYLIIGVSLLLAVVISWTIYRGISTPLNRLNEGMTKVRQGDLDTQIDFQRKDEFGQLMKSFNHMVDDQRYYIENIYEKQLRLTKAELKFLQSQMNPHFLYNTLDSIYWMSKNYDADEISDMILSLSKFMRLSLIKGSETISIGKNIEHLHHYLRVQQIRYSDRFSVKFHMEEETKRLHILKLLLQPLVENAIIHGLEKYNGDGEIKISSYLENDYLYLTVEDTGKGIGEERLQCIRQRMDQIAQNYLSFTITEEQTHQDIYGLSNLLIRLKLYYGDEARMDINSVETEGTKVTLKIPLDSLKEHAE
ncbi:histidine kinase [Gracilibacillus alcaliphilus]|uniref:histidine kinase n=1 Tax=Gracilibacillus alcaliphilus TaxID=1401441 RepID=UPI00195C343C|nr:two-component system sensor histidine kinase YesM [Gracilibacillus alcaliphilus]